MNRDLFLAILSMDSYNRGYEPGVKNLSDIGSKIGNAVIKTQSVIEPETPGVDAGFYGLAYDVSGAGIAGLSGTVIAYRGSDGEKVRDIFNGWPTGGGLYANPQASMAVEFYKTVVGVDANGLFTANPFTSDITLTGHSLGAGLAGYIASHGAANDNVRTPLAHAA